MCKRPCFGKLLNYDNWYTPKKVKEKSEKEEISSTAQKPSSVKFWCSFLNNVKSYQIDTNIKQYASPYFKEYDKIYDISKEDVRGELKNNILDNLHILTSSRNPVNVFKRISKEDR
ncbi:6863_t:CDS:2 [Dentiscutata heterogama]|uniref:6863_t:CDS:1 n=1 Tax=Dentiscutata heterogama TaxID=1316150 RepID=A0ACA9LED1_9GLOM|nr:6863_t:CDS:2 [Dentiscutata heterogama]